MIMRNLAKKINFYKKLNLYRYPYQIAKRKGKYIQIKGQSLINFASNDYLGIASSKKANKIISEAFLKYDSSSSSSKLICGNYSEICEAEKAYSQFFGYEDAMLFPSGYQANLAIISGLFNKEDKIVFDKHAHSSIIKGIILSGAEYHGFNHNCISHLSERLLRFKDVCVITESLFSMDGDILKVQEMKELKKKHHFFCIVDEAHAFGVLGEKGKGIARDVADIAVGTLGKAFGFFGAFVLMSKSIKEYLFNFSSPVIYSTAVPPAFAVAAKGLLFLVSNSEKERKRLKEISNLARKRLKEEGFNVGGDAHIVPLIIGPEERSIIISQELMKKGIFAPPVRYPTVPLGKAIIRINLTALHDEEDIEHLIKGLKDVWNK